jgi:hypothetical protein
VKIYFNNRGLPDFFALASRPTVEGEHYESISTQKHENNCPEAGSATGADGSIIAVVGLRRLPASGRLKKTARWEIIPVRKGTGLCSWVN